MTIRPLSNRTQTVHGGLELAALSYHRATAQDAELFWRSGHGESAFDHSAFDALLAKHVRTSDDGIARVDYRAWTRVTADRVALRHYIDALAAADPVRLNRDEQFAFWVNLYNALAINIVLQIYPIASIRKINPTPLAPGPWKQPAVQISGIDLSLDDIEHAILRKGWGDARLHYAINCASTGGANLQARAWRGEDLSVTLDAAARAYVNHPRGARFYGNGLVVSSIYKWYATDFGGADPNVITHLAGFAAPLLRARLQATRRISRDQYDWSLNAVAVGS